LARESQSFTQQEASQQHISAQEWEAWLADTLIAPIE
jgi:hypothetical protein